VTWPTKRNRRFQSLCEDVAALRRPRHFDGVEEDLRSDPGNPCEDAKPPVGGSLEEEKRPRLAPGPQFTWLGAPLAPGR
jgi:hypothetical protein